MQVVAKADGFSPPAGYKLRLTLAKADTDLCWQDVVKKPVAMIFKLFPPMQDRRNVLGIWGRAWLSNAYTRPRPQDATSSLPG